MNFYNIIIRPHLTEKSLNHRKGTKKQNHSDGNKLEFLVSPKSTKTSIKKSFEKHFNVKIIKVWTRLLRTGKHAIIKILPEDDNSMENLLQKIGIQIT